MYSLRSSWFSMARAWRLELPGDGHIIMAVRPRWSLGKIKLDCSFTNAAAEGEGHKITLKVRGQDSQHLVTHISYGEKLIACVRRMFDGGSQGLKFGFKPEYDIDVAGGIDLALVSVYLRVAIDSGDVTSRKIRSS